MEGHDLASTKSSEKGKAQMQWILAKRNLKPQRSKDLL